MTYEARKTNESASLLKLAEVVKAGEKLGLWVFASAITPEGSDAWRWVTVKTPSGLSFDLNGGSWGREQMITASVANLEGPHGIKVTPRDVLRYHESAPTESASHTRPAETIAKDLHKRVMVNPEGVACAQAMVDRLAAQMDSRGTLRGHMDVLALMGYSFDHTDAKETYSATGYNNLSKGPRTVKVTADGRIDFEVSTNMKTFKAVTALLNASKEVKA